MSFLSTSAVAEPQAVETVFAHYERSQGGQNGLNSGDARFAVGPNNNLLVDSIEVNGQLLQALRTADYGRIQRRERPECRTGVFAPGEYICGEKQAGFWEATALGNINNNRPENPADYADVFSSLVINRGIDNPFRNQSNNIERLDVIFREGLTAPLPQFLPWTGFMVSERAGNNTFRIAAILGLDAAGNPSQFGRIKTGLGSGVTDGNECLDLRTFSSFVIRDTDGIESNVDFYKMAINRYRNQDFPNGVGNGPLQHINTVQQCVFSQFFSFQELEVSAGQRVYGYAVFPRDVTEQMDLVGLSNVPLSTNAADNDSPDFFGGGGAAFMLPPQAQVSGVVYHSQSRVPLANVELALVSQITGSSLPTQCFTDGRNTQTTQADGRYVFNLALGDASCPVDVRDYRITTTRTPLGIQRAGSPTARIPAQPATLATDLCQANGVSVDTSIEEGCQIQSNVNAPEAGEDTTYFLRLALSSSSQLVGNNHIPLDGIEPDDPQPPVEEEVSLEKTVGRSTVSIGDIVDYNITVTNVKDVPFTDLLVRDEPPVGFSYEPGSARLVSRGPDAEFGTSDDIIDTITPALQGTTLVFGPWDLAASDIQRLTYKMRVGANVLEGRHNNTATPNRNGEPVGPTSVAGVRLVFQPAVEMSTVTGKVFHDRDKDGIQDSVLAKKLRLSLQVPEPTQLPESINIEHLGKTQSQTVNWSEGAYLGRLLGRLRETDPLSASQMHVRIPVPSGTTAEDLEQWDMTLASNGVKMHMRGLEAAASVSEFGDVASGFNSQQLRVERSLESGVLTLRIRNVAVMEEGIPSVRLATTQGLLIETDANGRFHLADAESGNWWRGGNFILKVDTVTLPKGSRFTTENPLLLRLTPHTLTRMNFGVTLPPQTVPETQVTVQEPDTVVESFETVTDGSLPPVRFRSGKAEITEEYVALLREKIELAKAKSDYTLSAVGHTDNVRVGLPETVRKYGNNQRLSEARAEVVADYLQDQLDIPEDKIRTAGRAQHEPVATNQTPEGRQLNRRTEVTLTYQQLKTSRVPGEKRVETRQLVGGGTLWALEDPLPNDPRLDVEVTSVATVGSGGELLKPVEFHAYSNYNAYIARWELRIYNASDIDQLVPLAVLRDKVLPMGQAIQWRATSNEFVAGEDLQYVLRVYDAEGRWDQTEARVLRLVSVDKAPKKQEEQDTPEYSEIYGRSNLAQQNIPISGSRVRLYGHGVDKRYQLRFNNAPVFVDGKGSFAVEEHYPVGDHRLAMQYLDGEGIWTREIPVDVTGQYRFMVGLANLTVGQNDVSGNIEALAPDERFDGSTYVDGRAAFYLKGKIKGKYLITAHLDTQEDDIADLKDNLKRTDPSSIFRRLDPDRYYPVYGDDSTTLSDVDTQGAYYLRVDWDKSKALWGNFHSNLTGTEFAQYNRSLYGAQLVYRSPTVTENGETRHFLNTFASEAQTAAGHNAFLATGGSLYYLRHKDLVQGSEKLTVEVRDKDGISVIERFALSPGADYEIDYIQGRILLSKPLSQVLINRAPNIIRDRPLEGDDVFLLADYEYVPDSGDFENGLAGVRGKTWVDDKLALGGTYVKEDRDANDYELKGADVTYRLGKGSYLKGEFAESEATQGSSGFASADGGLSFTARNAAGTARSGQAYGLEARVNLAEMSDGEQRGDLRVWSKKREAGFSSSRADDGIETEDSGVHARLELSTRTQLSLKANQVERTGIEEETNASVQVDHQINPTLSTGVEVKHQTHQRDGEDETDATIVGAMLSYLLSDETQVYATVQGAVDESDDYQSNDAASVGIRSRVNEALSLGAEAVSGDRGDALVLNADYALNEKASLQASVGIGRGADSQVGATYSLDNGTQLYGSFTQSVDRTDSERSVFTLGQRRKFGNGVNLFVENQFGEGDRWANVAHVVGVDVDLDRGMHVSTSVQSSQLKDEDGNRIDRDVLSTGFSIKRGSTRWTNRLELRRDKGNGVEEEQWLTSNGLDYRLDEEHRLIGKLNFADTEDKNTGVQVARFGEASLGWAYRPISHDRLSVLARYTYRYDQGSEGQDPQENDQRAHIVSLDGDYQLTRTWAVGSKIESRKGEIRNGRGTGDWEESGADLFALRGRYYTPFSIEALLEYRWLKQHLDDDTRHGALLAGYKKFSKNLRLGLGYSFATFDDDLSELDYDNHGWFIDLSAHY